MVDSPRNMINGSEHLSERVTAVERKVDGLSTRLDVLSVELHALNDREEEHYQQTAMAFAEQRSYTDALLAEMRSGFERMDSRFEQIDSRFVQIDSRFVQIDSRFVQIDSRFEQIDSRFDRVETSLGRLERKLDGFIDTQTRTNEIAERRLRRLEARG